MKIIGLTGPVAAGKDAVARVLRRRGAYIIDADNTAHQLYANQSPVWHELVRVFGSKILNRGGAVNRKKLAEIVFSDQKKLRQLNAIVHPYLKETIIRLIRDKRAEVEKQVTGTRDQIIVVNAAVLKEIGLVENVDEVWVVIALKETRMKRLLKAGLARPDARKRIGSQAAQAEYLALADKVIRNDGTLRQLNAKVQACL